MSNKIIFRIVGALSAATIIISLFVPFSMLQSEGLWDIYNNQGMLYLPIIILAFASFAVISFSLNIKPELSYISFGACLFYIIVKVVRMNIDGSLGNISLGFYLFVLGTVFIGIMSFLGNLGKKKLQTVNSELKQDTKSDELSISNSNATNSSDLFNPEPIQTSNNLNIASNNTEYQSENSSMNIFDSPTSNTQNIDNSYLNVLPSLASNNEAASPLESVNNADINQNYVNGQNIVSTIQPAADMNSLVNSEFIVSNPDTIPQNVGNFQQNNVGQDQNINMSNSQQLLNSVTPTLNQYNNLNNLENSNEQLQNTNYNNNIQNNLNTEFASQIIQDNNVSQLQNSVSSPTIVNNSVPVPSMIENLQYNNQLDDNNNVNFQNIEQVSQSTVQQDQVNQGTLIANNSNIISSSATPHDDLNSIPEIVSNTVSNNTQQENLSSAPSIENNSVPNLDIFGI